MKVIIQRTYKTEDKEILRKSIRRKYGRFEKIKTLLNVKGCSSPGLGEAYLLYLTISEGEEILEEVIIEDRKIFNTLSAKRFELIEFINTHGPISLKDLSRKSGRDYKNVYDDVHALEQFLILNVVKSGREKIPVGEIKQMDIRI